MTAALENLRLKGESVEEADLVHLSPARSEHVNPHGRYKFNLEEELGRTTLRELRLSNKSLPPEIVPMFAEPQLLGQAHLSWPVGLRNEERVRNLLLKAYEQRSTKKEQQIDHSVATS